MASMGRVGRVGRVGRIGRSGAAGRNQERIGFRVLGIRFREVGFGRNGRGGQSGRSGQIRLITAIGQQPTE